MNLMKNKKGVAGIDYAICAAFIAGGLFTYATDVKDSVADTYCYVGSQMPGGEGQPCDGGGGTAPPPTITPGDQCEGDGGNWFPTLDYCGPPPPVPPTPRDYVNYNREMCKAIGGAPRNYSNARGWLRCNETPSSNSDIKFMFPGPDGYVPY